MSRFNSRAQAGLPRSAAATLLALGCALSLPAVAGTGSGGPPLELAGIGAAAPPNDGRAPTDLARPEEQAPPPAAPKSAKDTRSMLRCWQEGRLVYEGYGFVALPRSQAAVELRPLERGNGIVQVLDLHQGLCVLELRDPN